MSIALLTLFLVSAFFLGISLKNLRTTFTKIESVKAKLVVENGYKKGISLVFTGRLDIETNDIRYDVEIVQLRVYDSNGRYLGSWTKDGAVPETFVFAISNVHLFDGKDKMKGEKINIDGFVKVKLNIGRYGMRLNLPVNAEVSISEEK
ncbi:MAG: hypothetical protein ACUVQF_07130 [Fervidobacterium sp.]|uniref:hypothetical protein n=1 Tax=Fervidobacterium sp. TaxID=1871331 RepID=UPI00404B78FC